MPRHRYAGRLEVAGQRAAIRAVIVLDDHMPFFDRGVPTLNLIDFEYGSAPGLNDYGHTDQDSLENISARCRARCQFASLPSRSLRCGPAGSD